MSGFRWRGSTNYRDQGNQADQRASINSPITNELMTLMVNPIIKVHRTVILYCRPEGELETLRYLSIVVHQKENIRTKTTFQLKPSCKRSGRSFLPAETKRKIGVFRAW